jgi:FADH2 O2-dependent halogenase
LPFNGRTPPYPAENAAVHHIFCGGWIWVLKFNNGITSAGVAATERIADEVHLRAGAAAWEHLIKRFPTLIEVFGPARNVVPFVHQPRITFFCKQITGRRWTLLPSAAGVVDPLLSTGFPLTLLGITRLGRLLQKASGKFRLIEAALPDYAEITQVELETTARLVGALYATMDRFELFKALSLLYFAAASFSEVARRLAKPDLAPSFLLCQDPEFAPQLIELCESAKRVRSPGEVENLKRQIMLAIEPFDLAGLTDSNRDPWYPASGDDIYRNATKLGVTREQIAKLFQ